MDDQKLTIFIPAENQDNLKQSLQEELRTVEARLHQSYKFVTITEPFSIQREFQKAGAGSSLYYIQDDCPNTVTAGALFVNLINYKVYILTTCHLDDATDKLFYFKRNNCDISLGKCVAYICQTNPVIEACLVELTGESLEQCSPLLSIHNSLAMTAFSGPYRGSLTELLAAPKEVMMCGGSSGVARGRMKYFAFDFPDHSTSTMIYGGIVTLPNDASEQFSQAGDSGSIISTASGQPFLVKNWGIDYHSVSQVMRDIDIRPNNDTAPKEIGNNTVELDVPDPVEQTVPKLAHDESQVTEVMAHEALSIHCFGYHMTVPEYGNVKVSISFRVTLAVEKLQEQIGAELVLAPMLEDSSQSSHQEIFIPSSE